MLEKYHICVGYLQFNTVQVFDCEESFKKIEEIQVNDMCCPVDMVGCSVTSQLFLSDKNSDNGVILRVNVNTGVSDVFIQLGFYGAMLSLVENRLLVTSDDSLFMYDIHSGQRMRKIPLTEEMKEYEVRNAIASNRDSFFVSHGQSDGVNNTVSEIDLEGRVIENKNVQVLFFLVNKLSLSSPFFMIACPIYHLIFPVFQMLLAT